MSEGYPNGPHLNKKTIVLTEKNIHGCSENSVSEEALFAALHGRNNYTVTSCGGAKIYWPCPVFNMRISAVLP